MLLAMLSRRPSPLATLVLGVAIFSKGAISEPDKFEKCKARIDRIQNGSEIFETEAYGTINKATIAQFIYNDTVSGMNKHYAQTQRDNFLTITTQGRSTDHRQGRR
jgi:hypothetical protein